MGEGKAQHPFECFVEPWGDEISTFYFPCLLIFGSVEASVFPTPRGVEVGANAKRDI